MGGAGWGGVTPLQGLAHSGVIKVRAAGAAGGGREGGVRLKRGSLTGGHFPLSAHSTGRARGAS